MALTLPSPKRLLVGGPSFGVPASSPHCPGYTTNLYCPNVGQLDTQRLQKWQVLALKKIAASKKFHTQVPMSSCKRWRCKSGAGDAPAETSERAEPSEAEQEEVAPPSTSGSDFEDFPAPTKTVNQRLALASVAVAISMFAATRGAGAGPDLNQVAASAMQYDEAISNGRPTVVEFYADWCVVCREMAKEIYRAEQAYKDKVNFVLLNIDNRRWSEEVEEYGVGGIPHFVFLDSDGVEEGSAVGKLPRSILEDNLQAMARGDKLLPHSGVVGQTSGQDQRPATLTAPPVVEPRTHG